jgi:hypothetical protein
MAGDARLALAEHLGELADGEFHGAQQGQNPHPGRIRQSREDT